MKPPTDAPFGSDEWIYALWARHFDDLSPINPALRAFARACIAAGMEEAAKTVADENCGSDFDCDGDCHNEDADAIRSRAAQIKGVSDGEK